MCIFIYFIYDFIQTPTTEAEWTSIASEFEENWNYPFCLGALDGKHIAIQKPSASGSLFYNYKNYFSIVLLALVDAKYKFLFVDVGTLGRFGDAGIYDNSPLKEAIENNLLNIPPPKGLPNGDRLCHYHVIADDAFSLSSHLIKPFPHRQLDVDKQIFNYRLSRARRVVENAFGILANRFRIFLTKINLSPEKVKQVVLAACCIHNYLIENTQPHGSSPRQNGTDGQMAVMPPTVRHSSSQSAKSQRDLLKDYFLTSVSVSWQKEMVV